MFRSVFSPRPEATVHSGFCHDQRRNHNHHSDNQSSYPTKIYYEATTLHTIEVVAIPGKGTTARHSLANIQNIPLRYPRTSSNLHCILVLISPAIVVYPFPSHTRENDPTTAVEYSPIIAPSFLLLYQTMDPRHQHHFDFRGHELKKTISPANDKILIIVKIVCSVLEFYPATVYIRH
jgi:hypothetical protein